jgi:hypothetical protein
MLEPVNPFRVLIKGFFLCLAAEFILYATNPDPSRLNVYRFPALTRQRFPISTSAPEDAALDMDNLNMMFASHIVSESKAPNEYRVLVLGDSAVWGIGLTPIQTLPGQMDALDLKGGNKNVHVYNLSFPVSSASKDLMILDKSMSYHPDEIIWLLTWYTLMPKTRTDHPLIGYNPDEYYKLAYRFHFLPNNYRSPSLFTQITDQNRTLFRVLRYQLYSLINIAIGLDQIPGPHDELPTQLSSDSTFEHMKPPKLYAWDVSLDQIEDFYQIAGNIPVTLVNEPMKVLTDVPNSDIYYNVYYPRWVYDQYRQYMNNAAMQNHWNYLDLWNIFPPGYFTDTPLHLNPQAETELAKMIAPYVVKRCQ